MQRAFDLALVEPTVRQLGVGMGADVVGGVDLAVEIVERDLVAGDDDAEHLALGEIATISGFHPTLVVSAHLSPSDFNEIASSLRRSHDNISRCHCERSEAIPMKQRNGRHTVVSGENALKAMIVKVSLTPATVCSRSVTKWPISTVSAK